MNRQPESNTLQVANEVHALISDLARTLPPGVHLEPFYDQSTIVHDSIASVRDAVLLGIVLSSIILVLFLRDWGTSLVAGLVIPITLLITFIVLHATGQSFNLMTLGGLAAAVGLVIDDAIVVLENIVLHRDAGQNRLQAIQSALKELTVPLIGSTDYPHRGVFCRLISITGVTGSFFRALADHHDCFSLHFAAPCSLSWTPALSQFFVRRKDSAVPATGSGEVDMTALLNAEEAHLSGFFGRIVDFYGRVMQSVLKRPWILAVSSVVIVVLSGVCYYFLQTGLLPEMDEGAFILDYFTPPGSSLAESNRILLHIEDILKSTPEVENTSRRTGLQLGLAAVTEANNGDFTVRLKKDRKRALDEITSDIRGEIEKTEPGTKVEFVQLLQDMIGDLTSAPEPVVIKLFSPDRKLLNETSPKVGDAISKIHGVVDVLDGVENTISGPAVTYQVNPAVAARAGFTPEEVAIDASAVLEGEPAATPVILNDRAYTIRVRFPEQARASLDRMTNTLLTSATRKTATLGSLATDRDRSRRDRNSQRKFTAPGASRPLVLKDWTLATEWPLSQKTISGLHLPSSIRIEYGGLYAEQQKSFSDLLMVLFLALLLLFTVLLFEFRTFLCADSDPTHPRCSPPSAEFLALLVTRDVFQRRIVHGHDHGDRHRRQERNFAARRRASLPRCWTFCAGSHGSGWASPPAPDCR